MSPISPAVNLSSNAVGGAQLPHSGLTHPMPTAVRSPIWLALCGSVIILGMLMTFHQVVHGAVQQGELRHKNSAAHTEATWRCKTLQGTVATGSCLLQLNTAYGEAALEAPAAMLASHDSFNLR